jgi:ribosome silencing factor RsfS/YbeB/iojap
VTPTRAPRRAAEAAIDPNAARIAELEAESAPTPRKRAAAAGPKKRGKATPTRAAPSPDRLEALVRAAVATLEDDKAEDVVVLDVSTRSAFADRLVVATGLAERQIEAMARHVEEALAEQGIRRIRTEASPEWVLLDAGDLVIHLFKPEARANYALERMWGPESPAPEESSMPEPRPDTTDEAGEDAGPETDDETGPDGEQPDPREPMVDGGPEDAQAGDAQDRLNMGEVGDGRPAGDGNGAILPPGEALDGPAGFAFDTTGEDLQPNFPDELSDAEDRTRGQPGQGD